MARHGVCADRLIIMPSWSFTVFIGQTCYTVHGRHAHINCSTPIVPLPLLTVCLQVATVWIHQLWQFAQIFNLFMGARRYTVNMGYNSRDIQSIKELCHDVLIVLEENGGEDATALVRRCVCVLVFSLEYSIRESPLLCVVVRCTCKCRCRGSHFK